MVRKKALWLHHPWWLALAVGMVLSTTSPVLAAPRDYRVDPVHSYITFRVKHLGISWSFGRFNKFSGKIVYDPKNPASSSVRVVVEAASIDTGNQARDSHLRGKDFFLVEKYPTITFESTKVEEVAGSEGKHLKVTGNLTLRGITKEVSLEVEKLGEAQDPSGAKRVGFFGVLTIRRSDFGMTYMMGGIGNQVELYISLEAASK